MVTTQDVQEFLDRLSEHGHSGQDLEVTLEPLPPTGQHADVILSLVDDPRESLILDTIDLGRV